VISADFNSGNTKAHCIHLVSTHYGASGDSQSQGRNASGVFTAFFSGGFSKTAHGIESHLSELHPVAKQDDELG
jgi:hypothetical protein